MAQWIWTQEVVEKQKEEAVLVWFRKTMEIDTLPKELKLKISAETRYKLYINGILCELGPIKGDNKIWFYDVVDISAYLISGMNTIAVLVLHYPYEREGKMSLFRTNTPGLYLEALTKGHKELESNSMWKCKVVDGFRVVRENPFFFTIVYLRRKKDCIMGNWAA